MSLSKQLSRWTQAQLIDQATADKILAYERSNTSASLGAWVVGLGALGVGMGIIALVASNWEGIPGPVKIVADLLLLAGLGYAILRWHPRPERRLASEVAVALLFFLTLASLALVGQVYQLEGPLYRTWGLWLLSTLGLMLHARSWFLILLWASAWVVGYLLGVEPIADSSETATAFWPVIYLFAAPLVFDLAGRWPWGSFSTGKHAHALRGVSIVATAVGAFAATFSWYEAGHGVPRNQYWLTVVLTLVITAVAIARGLRCWRSHKVFGDWVRAALWVTAWANLALAPAMPFERVEQSMAALMQFAVLALWIAWSHACGSAFWVRFCVIAAAIRILVAYIEVFGSLLDTGLALIGGGVLVLALSWAWQRWIGKWIPQEGGNS